MVTEGCCLCFACELQFGIGYPELAVLVPIVIVYACFMIYCTLRGITPIDWDTGCAIFLGYFFGWKIHFWVYFIACNKFLGQDFNLE